MSEGISRSSLTANRHDSKLTARPPKTDLKCSFSFRLPALLSDALAIWHAGLAAVRSDQLVRDALHVEGPLLVDRR